MPLNDPVAQDKNQVILDFPVSNPFLPSCHPTRQQTLLILPETISPIHLFGSVISATYVQTPSVHWCSGVLTTSVAFCRLFILPRAAKTADQGTSLPCLKPPHALVAVLRISSTLHSGLESLPCLAPNISRGTPFL